MLSRVAAVKAPRTHNRRRVTGSRGRRREGGESEPQRPNMSRHLFYSAVLLLLVMKMCCGTGGATATEKPKSGKGSSPSPSFVWKDGKGGETVSSLRVPSLVEMNGDVFAVAEAQCKDESGFTGIASELLTLTDKESKGELDTTKLKTQVLEECPSQNKNCASKTESQDASQSRKKLLVSRPTTVVNGSDIYMFAGTYRFEVTEGVDQTAAAAKWGLLVASGNFRTEGSDKRIYWNDAYVIPWSEFETQQKSLTGLIGGGGSGVKMNDGTLVLPVEGTKTNGKAVSLTLYSTVTGGGNLSKGMSADGCGVPSVVEWKDKLMMMTVCDDGRRRVYESADKGDSWTEALGTLSRVWSNKQGEEVKGVRSGFITATIGDDKRNVMLVTLPVYSKEKDNSKGVLHLWLTDNTHIVDIGPVSGETEDAAASSLLYKSGDNNNEEKLIALYEKKKDDEETSHSLWSVLLTAQLQRVKEVLATWKEVDDRVSKLCPLSSATVSKSTGTACTTDKITDGLVGFLSGSFSDGTWRDEYLGVNATVNENVGAAKAENGVTFRGAWAEWPVGEQGANQLYHFANYNFTLVVTVSVHGEPKGDNPIPLVGARMNDDKSTVLLGLSYNNEKKWELLSSGGTTKEHNSTWEPGKTYQVAIVLRNGKQGSAYIDGQRVGDASCELKNVDSKGISHFYIGGDGGSAGGQEGVSVTVRNVLLYNRPLTFSGPDAEVERDVASPAGAVSRTKTGGEIKTEGKPATTQQVPTASSSHAVGEAAGNAGTMRGSGPPPSLLLLLGLWGFAAL
ncbi:putative trans-sialidase, Group V [Trypanosoma cruzi]|nr:putative trans-sialidase, Group V [Trypanosoma cruzi]